MEIITTAVPIWICIIQTLYYIFGGNILDDTATKSTNINRISVLDLNCDDGWQEIKHIQCPLNSNYLAVLTADNHIHLITETNVWPNWRDSKRRHYSIHISTILGSKYQDEKWKMSQMDEDGSSVPTLNGPGAGSLEI